MTGPLEIVVWEPFPPGEDPVRFQRRLATVRIKPDGSVLALDRMRKTVTGVWPLRPGESVWRLIERAAARMARGDEIDAIGGSIVHRPSGDPLAAVAMFDSMVLGFVRVVAETPEEPAPPADDNTTVHRGSGDFLADQGYENPDLTRAKFFIAHSIAGMLEDRHLSPLDASVRYGVDLGLLTAVYRGLADDCPLDGLIDALKAMGKNVLVVVSDAAEKTGILWATTTESDY